MEVEKFYTDTQIENIANNIQQNDNGLNLQQSDTISYVKFLSTTAAKYGMKIGLKNSLSIIPDVLSVVDFAVNEQCSVHAECAAYAPFLQAGKPVVR